MPSTRPGSARSAPCAIRRHLGLPFKRGRSRTGVDMAMPNTAFTRAINNCRWSGSRTFGYGAADLSVGADDPADFAVAGMGLGAEAGSQMTRSCPQILNPSRYRKNGPHWAARPLSPNYVSLRKAGYFCVEQPSAYDLCGRAEMVRGDLSATPPARPTILNPAGSSAFAWRLPNPATTSYRLTCRHRSYEPGWQT